MSFHTRVSPIPVGYRQRNRANSTVEKAPRPGLLIGRVSRPQAHRACDRASRRSSFRAADWDRRRKRTAVRTEVLAWRTELSSRLSLQAIEALRNLVWQDDFPRDCPGDFVRCAPIPWSFSPGPTATLRVRAAIWPTLVLSAKPSNHGTTPTKRRCNRGCRSPLPGAHAR